MPRSRDALQITVQKQRNRVVVLFSEPVDMLMLPKDDALDFARKLYKHADAIKAGSK